MQQLPLVDQDKITCASCHLTNFNWSDSLIWNYGVFLSGADDKPNIILMWFLGLSCKTLLWFVVVVVFRCSHDIKIDGIWLSSWYISFPSLNLFIDFLYKYSTIVYITSKFPLIHLIHESIALSYKHLLVFVRTLLLNH